MPKYGKKSQEKVKEKMHEFKLGKLKSGKSGKTVKNPKQAVAIGLSEARKKGARMPPSKKNNPLAKDDEKIFCRNFRMDV